MRSANLPCVGEHIQLKKNINTQHQTYWRNFEVWGNFLSVHAPTARSFPWTHRGRARARVCACGASKHLYSRRTYIRKTVSIVYEISASASTRCRRFLKARRASLGLWDRGRQTKIKLEFKPHLRQRGVGSGCRRRRRRRRRRAMGSQTN